MKEKITLALGTGAVASLLLYMQHNQHEKEMLQAQAEKELAKLNTELAMLKTYNKALQNELKYCHRPTGNTFDLDALMRDFENFKKTLK